MKDISEQEEDKTNVVKAEKKVGGLKILLIFIALILCAAVASAAWLYTGGPSETKEKVFRVLPIPVALVGNKPISQAEYFKRLDAAEKYYSQSPEGAPKDIKKQVMDSIIGEFKLKLLAEQKGFSITGQEIDAQYANMVKDMAGGDEKQLETMISQYGMDKEDFKKQVISSDLLRVKLAVWFNEQRDLNQPAYKIIDEAQSQLNEGKNLESLAKQYSQDEASSQLEGDVGFVEESQLLPEFQKALDGIDDGKTALVVSRFGLHMLKVQARDNNGTNGTNRVHLKQIFVKAEDPTNWYNSQVDKIKTRTLIKI